MKESEPVYTISVVECLTGLSARRIRYYDKVGLVVPGRTSGGQRRYSWRDVERLLYIKGLMEEGYSIEDVREHFAIRRGASGSTS